LWQGTWILHTCSTILAPVIQKIAGDAENFACFWTLWLGVQIQNWDAFKWLTQDRVKVTNNIVACRPVARQQPQKKQLYNSHWQVTASQTSMFPWLQLHSNNGTVFYVQPVPICYKQDS
jgi:hypothetical protein